MDENTHIGQYIIDYFLNDKMDCTVLENWLSENDKNRSDFEKYQKIWKAIPAATDFDASTAWGKVNKVNQRNNNIRKRIANIMYTTCGVAASVLVFIMLSVFGVFTSPKPNYFATMETEYGSRSNVELPDGSFVKLNAASKITYHFDNKKKIREVNFTGEGFFNVAKSEEPFIISISDSLKLKVLGTTFNLRAYDEDNIVQTTLIGGKVELCHADEKTTISCGQTIIYNKLTGKVQYVEKQTEHVCGWIKNKLYMDDLSLYEVCKLLERRYDVSIYLQDNIGEKFRYNGVLQEESINDVMNALQTLSKIEYSIKGKNISINEKT